MSCFRIAACLAAVIVAPVVCFAAAPFIDNFNTVGSAANYTVVTSDITSAFPTYAYNYAAMGIPSAPNSGYATTLGLKLEPTAWTAAAESITSNHPAFRGDYSSVDRGINVTALPAAARGRPTTHGRLGRRPTNNRGGFSAPASGTGGWSRPMVERNGIDYRLPQDPTFRASPGQMRGTHATARTGLDLLRSYGTSNVQHAVQGAHKAARRRRRHEIRRLIGGCTMSSVVDAGRHGGAAR